MTPEHKEALRILNDLYDLQNGPPLEQYREEWEKTMEEAAKVLAKYLIGGVTPKVPAKRISLERWKNCLNKNEKPCINYDQDTK